MSIERKYKKLVETALHLIRVDNEIMQAIREGDIPGEQVGLVNRFRLLAKIQMLSEWKEERRGQQFE